MGLTMIDEVWDARRKKLEAALVDAALELAAHHSAHGFTIPVPGTTPVIVVTLGQQKNEIGNSHETN